MRKYLHRKFKIPVGPAYVPQNERARVENESLLLR
mgnify:FL=1